jgi:hypothetical protein
MSNWLVCVTPTSSPHAASCSREEGNQFTASENHDTPSTLNLRSPRLPQSRPLDCGTIRVSQDLEAKVKTQIQFVIDTLFEAAIFTLTIYEAHTRESKCWVVILSGREPLDDVGDFLQTDA